MKIVFITFVSIFIFNMTFAQQYDHLEWLEISSDGPVSFSGDLSEGYTINDISWAWSSAVACFPQTQSRKFTGHHVLYAFDLPAFTEMEIWLVPEDQNANFSIYTYMVGTISDANTVPNLSSCIRCEADHKWDYKKRGQVQDHTRHIKDILALANPYQVIIGVVGAEGLVTGKYELFIRRKK